MGAMRAAIRLASESNAELVLFHAWSAADAGGDYAFADGVISDLERAARNNLEDAVRGAMAHGATRTSATLVNGPPWSSIVDALADRSFDLVVMSTHGRTGLRRVLLGSVTEKVVRHAPCPVLTVHSDGEPGPFQNVLVPVDFSPSAHDALKLAAQLVSPGGIGITLLHVIEVPESYRGERPITAGKEVKDDRVAEALDRWAGELRAAVSVPIQTRWAVGWPGPEILAIVESDRALDLVVMASHGRTGIKRAMIGSVAEKVVRYAPCAVAVARRPKLEHE